MENLKSELLKLTIDSKKKKTQTLEHHNLSLEDIIEIDDLKNLKKMIENLKSENIIGLDCEWHFSKNQVDLMQIGTPKKIYLVKINELFIQKKEWDIIKKKNFNKLIEKLITEIFHNKNIIKVSYDYKKDSLFLRNRFPHFKEFLTFEQMFDIRYFNFKDKYKNKIYGLAAHSEYFLKLKLDKTFQKSNWLKKDLSEGQKVYASLDVLVVLELYEFFKKSFPKYKPGKVIYSKNYVNVVNVIH